MDRSSNVDSTDVVVEDAAVVRRSCFHWYPSSGWLLRHVGDVEVVELGWSSS